MVATCDAVIFDFDLTLADSARGARECANYALEVMGHARQREDAIDPTVGLTLRETYTQLTGRAGEAERERFAELFVERADEVMAGLTTFYPGTAETLRWLRQRRMPVGIVSTKLRRRIAGLLEREGVSDLVDVVVGWEDVTEPKPSPEGIRVALGALGRDANHAIYVGDSVVDARAADAANLPFVAVDTGPTPAAELLAHGAVAVLADVGAVRGWVACDSCRKTRG